MAPMTQSTAPLPRVLIVDDEAPLAGVIASYFERDGFETTIVGDGEAAIAKVREWNPGVVVLDLGLPGVDGLQVCRTVRTFSDCYIVILTARADETHTLVGLSAGADDYMTKPFSPRELLARVRAMLRRPRTGPAAVPEQLTIGPLLLDVAAREVRLDGVPVDLTRTEFDVLAALASRPRGVWNRRQLIEEVWGRGWVGDEHLVDVHVGHLRRKLGDDPASPRFVRTVRGVGYRFRAED